VDFDDTPEEAAFRARVRGWLAEHASPKTNTPDDPIVFFDHGAADDEEKWVQACRAWQHTKNRDGYAAIRWPSDWGGLGGTIMQDVIFSDEESRFDVATGAFGITMGMVAPTIATHGTAEQRAHLTRILCGEQIWCQLFSEPGAGSDLAGLQTRAFRDGDEWVLTGQKVWTSGAHYADWGYLLARTDPSVPKHRGLTAFLIPMDTPGVVIRPLRQMTGDAPFNEVFFDGARVPDANRLGAQGDGWRVAITTLMNERFSAGGLSNSAHVFAALLELVKQQGAANDPNTRQRVADLYTRVEVHRLTLARALTSISKGREPGPEGSLAKLTAGRVTKATGDIAIQLLGASGMLENKWSALFVTLPGVRLGGGTDEVMRNILGERVLGLPREPQVGRDVPVPDNRAL
jgi:alkylation response protein AidB-like acyl-CoA dehydrogenase